MGCGEVKEAYSWTTSSWCLIDHREDFLHKIANLSARVLIIQVLDNRKRTADQKELKMKELQHSSNWYDTKKKFKVS